jgi:signal transduction histidine kinase
VSSLDYSTTLTAITRLIVPLLGDVAFFDLVEEDGKIVRYAPQLSRTILSATDTPQATVMESGQPMLVPACSSETMQRALSGGPSETLNAEQGSLLLVPLQARDRNLGVMTCVMAGAGRHHSATDLRLAQQIAARAAMAVDNARLYFAARRAIRAREDVAAIVSHDLRNPLMGIRLHCEHLRETQEMRSPAGMRHVEAIERGVKSMERLIRDLLDMSRIEAGQLVIYRGEQELGSLVTEAVNAVRPLAERKGIGLAVTLPARAAEVYCDRERILQVLSNLLGNAVKFTGTDGTIKLEVAGDDEQSTFIVRDTGVGIPPDHLPHLFERYWRANRTDNKGVGLGLYIAKAIIAAHGGDIVVESDVGAGTMVRFSIPRHQPAAAATEERAPVADRSRSA